VVGNVPGQVTGTNNAGSATNGDTVPKRSPDDSAVNNGNQASSSTRSSLDPIVVYFGK
jgi:hypothetical protein